MSYVILVTLLLLIQYAFFMMRAGAARASGGLKAPATAGNDHYERCNRIHINTLEQLAITLPTMWICASYFRPDVAAILGIIFFISRFVYSAAYLSQPEKRGIGMMIGFVANIALLLCCLYIVIMQLI